MTDCECGAPVKHKRTGECGKCYQRRWYRENRATGTGNSKPIYPLPTVGYTGAHRRVYAARGKASEHTCAYGCGRMAQEWSYIHGADQEQTGLVAKHRVVLHVAWSPDPQDYEPLCVPCHHEKDRGAA